MSGCSPRRRILYLLYRFPYPLIGGDRVKSYYLLKHLAEIAEVDVITMDEAGTVSQENLKHIEQFANVTVVPFNKLKAAARVAAALPTSTPIEIAYYNDPAFRDAVERATHATEYDLIVSFFLRTGQFVTGRTTTPRLLIAEDARVTLQERASLEFSFSPQYLVRKLDAKRLKEYEPRVSQSFDHVTYVAEEDRARIAAGNPRLDTSILTNGVDLHKFTFSEGPRQPVVLFAGHLEVYHNHLMAERLITEVFPLIRSKRPDARLMIVGKNPSRELTSLIEKCAGAELHADVPSVIPYLHQAGVFVHPQRVGSGIQNKLLEAMAAGIPVVTTDIGAQGIGGLRHGEHAFVESSNEAIAGRALSILNDLEASRELTHRARRLIEEQYTWPAVYDQLDEVIRKVVPDFFDTFATRPQAEVRELQFAAA